MTVPLVVEKAFSHYLATGIPRAPAAAMVAVFYAGESRLNPSSHGAQPSEHGGLLNRAGSVGIAAWNGPADPAHIGDPKRDRQAALAVYAETHGGQDPFSLECQLDFAVAECKASYPTVYAAMSDGTSLEAFLDLFVRHFEVPANPVAEIERSLPVAKAIFDLPAEIKTTKPPVTPPIAPVTPPVASVGPSSPFIPKGLPDPELAALTQIWEILFEFELSAARRMTYYLYSRFNPPL